ncbi:qhypothetical protein [Blastocystis sp. subtype 4]|uniref:qhypothetical protein n=1 Tax=Blastocystis sp. subtype 4 TaxID=944170 RepID=UPI000711FEA1|nr:qhypothetical protein [Blastocystis sp. subtype 4]KNB42732.1 qhypothetical protein [Blastocystis sp. subtype 4]|eukprot:XP_014526175.1 qhypothetical protein [Blastocystis sp. subtype 4]
MPSIAEWDSIYNKTLEMISRVKGALDPHSGTKDFAKVQTQLDVVENNIRKMQADLTSMSQDAAKYKLTDREIKRRANMIDGLLREKKDCDTKFASSGGNLKMKNQLVHANVDPESLTKQSDADLHHMQEQIFANQEQALVDISDTLGRLHEIGSAIGTEADLHKLLDEMDSNVDVAKNRLMQESKRAKKVSKSSGMCRWYCVIILLLILLIYQIVFYFKN